MNTERFVEALSECKLNPTEIADILWLALRQPSEKTEPAPPEKKLNPAIIPSITGSSNLEHVDPFMGNVEGGRSEEKPLVVQKTFWSLKQVSI